MMSQIYLLALVVALASALAITVRKLKQPLVVSYIGAGAILSLFHVVRPEQLEFLKFLPEIGLAFLLFLVGMELDFKEFKMLGKTIFLAGIGQIVISTLLLMGLAAMFGILGSQALILALSLSFSSTILVVKLLVEKKELFSLHGKLAIGILLLEDLLAIVMLMILTLLGSKVELGFIPFALVFIKGFALIAFAIFLGKYVLPRIFSWTAENSELLFLTSIAWCLVFVSVSQLIGFSLAIGAFLAGVSLAQSTYRIQISGKIKPLRDFFIMVFFIDLGAGLSFSAVGNHLGLALAVLAYAIIVKPLVFYLLFMGCKLRAKSSFETSIVLSSISEFSLIVLFLAGRTGLFDPELTSTIIFATVLSFVISSFLITHSRLVFGKLQFILKALEGKNTLSFDFLPTRQDKMAGHAVLIGCHRSGEVIAKSLKRIYGDRVLVVDFNPEVITKLKNEGVYCVFGDISDPEVQEQVNLKEAQLVISTVRDLNDNIALLDALEKIQSPAVAIITAADTREAIKLYEKGAHHVSIPVNLEGLNISRLISDYHQHWPELVKDRERKLGELKRSTTDH